VHARVRACAQRTAVDVVLVERADRIGEERAHRPAHLRRNCKWEQS
jgi:hypothetical protein